MKTTTLTIAIFFLVTTVMWAQVSINKDQSEAHPSAMLEVKSNSSGFLLPRMTTNEQLQIKDPAPGLLIFNTETMSVWFFDGAEWISLIADYENSLYPWVCGNNLSYYGLEYPTLQIGEQCWMQQNLNIGEIIEGNQTQRDNGVIEKYCYDNDPQNCELYGGLYQWDEMMNYTVHEGSQGICPPGWHIPSDADWATLVEKVGGQQTAGGSLKEQGTFNWEAPNTNGTNESGFTALPAGAMFEQGQYTNLNTNTYFRSSTMISETATWFRHLKFNSSQIFRDLNDKSWGFSVRCIRN